MKNGCIYKFTCAKDCEKTYIGESKRLLKKRIREHTQPCRSTAIFKHISECEYFKESLSLKLMEKPNSKPAEQDRIKINHMEDHFRPMAFSSNYYKRTTIEALMITLYDPVLNDQIVHKKVFLL